MADKEKLIRINVEFSGAVSLELPHEAVTMSAEEAILLGFRLIQFGIHSQTEPQTSHTVTLH